MISEIKPLQFVKAVKPFLAAHDVDGLGSMLTRHFGIEHVIDMLRCDQADARKVAILSLGLIGKSTCAAEIAAQLHDPDPVVSAMAEHALWSIWFRSSQENRAIRLVAGAVDAMKNQDLPAAIALCGQAIRLDPSFAEAYHQRALALCEMEDFNQSILDCRQATKLMPTHFAAWSTMGHCHIHQDNLASALECYQRAVRINPRLTEIRQAVKALSGAQPVPVA